MLGVTEGLECTFMLFYAILIFRIGCSNDSYFKTPFFTFFLLTTGILGVCGILSVLTFMSHHFTHLTLTYSWACIIKTFWILNHVGAIGSLLGKLIIIINRYSVLRSTDLLEKKWSRVRVSCLIAVQILVPLLTSTTMLFYGYKYANVNGVDVIYSFTDEGVTASKAINTSYYIRLLRGNKRHFHRSHQSPVRKAFFHSGRGQRKEADSQEPEDHVHYCRRLCGITPCQSGPSGALCGTTLLLNMPEATDAVWRLYPYANGLATYTAPVVLVIFSSKVRCLFLPKNLFKSSSVESTTSDFAPQQAYRI